MLPKKKPTDLPFEFSSDVKQQLHDGGAVVALESTIITHGMPWPQNLETALAVEDEVRKAGAVPATIAVLDGQVKVGLSSEELQQLAQTPEVDKLSRADLPACIIKKRTGSTTVAATMLIAELAGIRIFATGGIGGVHVDVTSSFDISTDLTELAKTSVVVVCAGAKAILDLPVAMRDQLGIEGGILVCNPLPQNEEISQQLMRKMIEDALAAARDAGVTGKAVTPFLLSKLFDLSDGETLICNVALIRNNARLAARLATQMASVS